MDKLIVLAGAAVLILLLVLACGLAALALFYLSSSQPQPQNATSPQQNATNATQPPTTQPGNESISAEDFALWMLINKANVESACYTKAREEAGSNAWAVKGCTCQETATPERKQYACTIATLDPTGNYFANIDCSLPSAICQVDTNYGSQNVTFGELRQLYNTSGG